MWTFRTVSLGLFVAVSVLSALGFLLTLAFLIFNVRYRKVRVVRMSSPNLNILIAIGAILSYCCCTLFAVSALLGYDLSTTTIICQVRTWLLTLSLTLVFGTMLAKSWRVHRIFRVAGTHRVVIKDEKLVGIVAALIFADIIILSFWHGLDPLKAQVHPVGYWERQFSGYFNLTPIAAVGCSSEHIPVWLSVMFMYKAVLLVTGLYLSWATRNVVLPAMNESKYTILGTFTTTVFCSVASALSVVLRSSPDAVCACLSGSVWLSATVCLLLVFVPKIRMVQKTKNTEFIRRSMKLTPTSESSSGPKENTEEELCQLMAENKLLKKSLSEKESAIQSLQEHLDSAKVKLEQLAEEAEVKNDSGLEFDISSSSSHEEEVGGRQIQVKPRHECEELEKTTLSVISEDPGKGKPISRAQRSESMHSLRTSRRVVRKHSQSGGSVRSERLRSTNRCRLAALRDSIAEDLQHAHSFSSDLRDSISKDLDKVSCRDVIPVSAMFNGLMCAGSRKGLAGSIAESYNFGPGGDDWAYIHQFLQVSLPPTPGKWDSKGPKSRSEPGPRTCPDGCSVLSNDQLYPDSPSSDKVQPRPGQHNRRSLDLSKRPGSKYMVTAGRRAKIHDNVYVIQNPQAKHMVTSCIAQKKSLQSANGTFCFEVLDSFV